MVELESELALPDSPVGLVLFAHGSGSSRHSPRNRYVARALQEGRLGTLLMDLLTPPRTRLTRAPPNCASMLSCCLSG